MFKIRHNKISEKNLTKEEMLRDMFNKGYQSKYNLYYLCEVLTYEEVKEMYWVWFIEGL